MAARLAPFAFSLLVLALDRVTKLWIERNLSAVDTWVIIPGLFNIIHAENRGMAFSLLADASPAWRAFLLIGVSLAVVGFLAVLLWREGSARKNLRERAALSLVVGGAIGNLYDRITRGSVTDFLDVYIGEYHWPTFNVADSAITVGAALLVLDFWLHRRGKAQP